MALKSIKIGDLFESEYEDDGGINPALETDGIVRVSRAPTDPDDVVRNQDAATAGEPYLIVAAASTLSNARNWVDGNGIESTDNGGGSSFVVAVKESEVDHNLLKNYVANEHIDWSISQTLNIHDDNISESSVTQHEQALDTYPRRVEDVSQPTPAVGELMIWRDASNAKVYILYNDSTDGVKKVELT